LEVTYVNTDSAPDVISVAREVPTLPASDVTTVKTLPAPLVTVLATPVATETAPEVTTDKMEESCAAARGAATRGRRRVARCMLVVERLLDMSMEV
jgi:hypothetical protein